MPGILNGRIEQDEDLMEINKPQKKKSEVQCLENEINNDTLEFAMDTTIENNHPLLDYETEGFPSPVTYYQ